MTRKGLLLSLLLIICTVSVATGGVFRWLFGGSDDDDYDEDSSEEGGDGPFNMVTETYNPEEDYEDYEL